MKKQFLLLLFTGILSAGRASNTLAVPLELSNALNAKYPKAEKVEWEHPTNVFKAHFVVDGQTYEAEFNNNAEWKKTQKEIKAETLPAGVKEYLQTGKFSGWNIQSAYILLFPYIKSKYHVIVINPANELKSLLFNTEGKMVKENFEL